MGRSWLLAVEGPLAPRYLVQKALREYLLLVKPRGLAVLELHHERNLLRLALQSANAPPQATHAIPPWPLPLASSLGAPRLSRRRSPRPAPAPNALTGP